MTRKTRIIVADDHPIVLAGLRNLIRAEPDLELIGEAMAGQATLKLAREVQPDVVVLDISMPELNGIVLTRKITEACPAVRVVILTAHEDRAYLKQGLQAGARGYVLKRSAAESLAHVIRAVMGGGLYVDPAIAGQVFDSDSGRSGAAKSATELTAREAEVIKLIALGLTNKEIARQLGVSVKSVETFKARGSDKLDLKTRAEIVRYASAQGWLAEI